MKTFCFYFADWVSLVFVYLFVFLKNYYKTLFYTFLCRINSCYVFCQKKKKNFKKILSLVQLSWMLPFWKLFKKHSLSFPRRQKTKMRSTQANILMRAGRKAKVQILNRDTFGNLVRESQIECMSDMCKL